VGVKFFRGKINSKKEDVTKVKIHLLPLETGVKKDFW